MLDLCLDENIVKALAHASIDLVGILLRIAAHFRGDDDARALADELRADLLLIDLETG